MEDVSVQKKVQELKEYFQNHEFDKAEPLFADLLEKYPNYHTPVILYTQLFSVIELDNPLYDRVMELTRQFSLWNQYPEHLVPIWYTKIRPRNILLKTNQAEQKLAENISLPDLGDLAVETENFNLPDSVPIVEEPVNEPAALVNPEELLPSDMDIEIAEEPVTDELTELDELDSLMPNMSEKIDEVEEKQETYNTNDMFDDAEEPISESVDEIGELDALSNLHTDDNFMDENSVEETHPDDEILVASETMAEIFIQQKKYKQAIKVYRILMEDDAENFDYFFKKVQELEQLKG